MKPPALSLKVPHIWRGIRGAAGNARDLLKWRAPHWNERARRTAPAFFHPLNLVNMQVYLDTWLS
jgi:hypothetical protein